ncbi:MAG: ribbon-helix-helix protein, CopG family [Candidatus Eremiobacteraeota bacterium]|nr:ribbon-helix-helix protein, CopG family [Candidatus Eremiobacteraeota bacterium]
MIRTQIQLTEEQALALKKMAAARNESTASLIREAVNLLIESVQDASRAVRIEKALAVAGRFTSEQKDLSLRHDSYLFEEHHP